MTSVIIGEQLKVSKRRFKPSKFKWPLLPRKPPEQYQTFVEWTHMQRVVLKGQKARYRNRHGEPVFAVSQTISTSKPVYHPDHRFTTKNVRTVTAQDVANVDDYLERKDYDAGRTHAFSVYESGDLEPFDDPNLGLPG